jgi:hypothetical protein
LAELDTARSSDRRKRKTNGCFFMRLVVCNNTSFRENYSLGNAEGVFLSYILSARSGILRFDPYEEVKTGCFR